eukprot:TRINITY_DN10221_c0_g1_i1.p1 TRINITY_DN10221_c0_g1~~TRINITY_DN10221_c0_g1_i1.p1  ORF type:complete len:651 (+),score=128.45 TRINITY_DN10221_c0_g1_i1:27-1979(+)
MQTSIMAQVRCAVVLAILLVKNGASQHSLLELIIPTPIDTLHGADVAADSLGDTILVAWLSEDSLVAENVTQQQLGLGVFNQTALLASGGDDIILTDVAVSLSQGGSRGLITWTEYVPEQQLCLYHGTVYLGATGFGSLLSLGNLTTASQQACYRAITPLLSRDDGWLVYASSNATAATTVNDIYIGRLAANSLTNVTKLCCEDTYGVAVAARQWYVAQSYSALATMAALRTNGSAVELTIRNISLISGSDNDVIKFNVGKEHGQLDVTMSHDGTTAIVGVTFPTRVVLYIRRNSSWQGPVSLYNTSSPEVTLAQVDINLLHDGALMVTFQLQTGSITNLILCNTTLTDLDCRNTPLYVADDGIHNTQFIATGGSQYGVLYSMGMGSATTSPALELTAGFYSDPLPDSITLNTSVADQQQLCNVNFKADVLLRKGVLLASWQSATCDNCSSCLMPEHRAGLALWSQASAKYTCNAQAQCVLAGSNGTFPDLPSCQDGCIPLATPGYMCSDDYTCQAVNASADFATKASCQNACMPQSYVCSDGQCQLASSDSAHSYTTFDTCQAACNTAGKRKSQLSAGTVVLLVLGLGLILPYFLGGIMYKRFVKGARGTEMIPHVDFWTRSLPTHIQDGFRYVCCSRGARAGNDYQKI